MKILRDWGWILLFGSFVFLPASFAWADGGYFTKTDSVAISADQRAILIKTGNDISMTFSTGYTGEGEDFGWIIPTPVPPKIEDVREGNKSFFEFLDQITAPIEVQYTSSGCFPAGTAVLTADGLNPIERVSPGTEVYACDLTSDRWVLAKVLKRQSFEWKGDMVTIEMGSHTLQATGNQPIYVVRGEQLSFRPIPKDISIEDQSPTGQGRWVEARDLKEGDVLKKKDGTGITVTGLMSTQQTSRVYYIEVEQFHNCAVHREGILVHNGIDGKPLGEGKGEGSARPLVTVHGRVTLEHYDVSVLGAADALALLIWLQANEYQVSSDAKKIFDDYIERNWAFVAVKLNPSEERRYENEFLPPLTIKYRHIELVYPLLISSISTTEEVKITLYVIAEGVTDSTNFRIAELDYDAYNTMSETYVDACIRNTTRGEGKALAILWRSAYCPPDRLVDRLFEYERIDWDLYSSGDHPIFRFVHRFCDYYSPEGEMYLTRLEGRMKPADMTEDIYFNIAPYSEDFEVVFGLW